jgi:hypothetical protein
MLRDSLADAFVAGAAAALLGGIPSTLYSLWTGDDFLEPTRAAGAMLIHAQSSAGALIAAAAIVHCFISLFWAVVLAWMLPRRRTFWWALAAAAAIAVLDLRIIAPRLFPEVYALAFWPQFADHLAWGATVGAVLQWRFRTRAGSV